MTRKLTEQQRAQKRERERHYRRATHVGCEVWERSGIGVKASRDGVWLVTNDAINSAVKYTYREGIDDNEWIKRALRVFKQAMQPSPDD